MPIRFRCRYCHQLMGIARRKAGMPVHCPTCHAEVVVPQPTEAAPPDPPPPQPLGDAPAPLFERDDFAAFLQNPLAANPAPTAPPSSPPPPLDFANEDPPSPSAAAAGNPHVHPPGLLLSPAQATWLTVGIILLVALAFGAGLLVGYYWMD